MIDLPKRSDSTYKEIEDFKDYEFTNCIAYEMAIRNEELQKIIKKFNDLIPEIDFDKDKLVNEDEFLLFEKYKEHYHIDTSFCNFYKKTNLNFFENSEKIHDNRRELEGEIIEGILTLDWKKHQDKAIIEDSKFLQFKRPRLSIPKKLDKTIDLKINLNLPKDELIAYISKIKDEYDKDNSIIQSPLELIGIDVEKAANKKINKKLIADKFFIYDYVTSRLKQIREDNLSMYEEYEEQKQEILNNKYIDSKDRKIQLKELKREFEENTNIRKDELFDGIEGFSSGTAKRYYYDIKPFIDDCKYKELITGTIVK